MLNAKVPEGEIAGAGGAEQFRLFNLVAYVMGCQGLAAPVRGDGCRVTSDEGGQKHHSRRKED